MEAKLELSQSQNLLSTPSLSQIHADSSSTTQTGCRSPPWLQLFSRTTRLCFRPQQTARGDSQISCAIDDMATGRPRAQKYRQPCRDAYGCFAQCTWEHIYVFKMADPMTLKIETFLFKTTSFKAGPPLDLSFWSFFTFLHHGIEEVKRHLLSKFYEKIRRKSWSNVPPKLVACIGFL